MNGPGSLGFRGFFSSAAASSSGLTGMTAGRIVYRFLRVLFFTGNGVSTE